MAKPTGPCLVTRVPLRPFPSERWTTGKGMVRMVLSKVGMKGQEAKPCNLCLQIFPANPVLFVHPSPPHRMTSFILEDDDDARLSTSLLIRNAGLPLVD